MFTQCDVCQSVHMCFIQIETTTLLRIGITYMLKEKAKTIPKNQRKKKEDKKMKYIYLKEYKTANRFKGFLNAYFRATAFL